MIGKDWEERCGMNCIIWKKAEKLILYTLMSHFPIDTRNQYKTLQRDSLNLPTTIPHTFNASYGEVTHQHQPNYDRSMFNQARDSKQVEFPERNMLNDRLMETSQIYKNFGQTFINNNNMNPFQQQDAYKNAGHIMRQTREKREERQGQSSNFDRIFMGSVDYDKEVNTRLNGFDLVAKDTRFDSSKKLGETNVEMRSNRYLGMPGKNL